MISTSRRRLICACGSLPLLHACGSGGESSSTNTVTTKAVQGCTLSALSQLQTGGSCGQPASSSGSSSLDQAFKQEFALQRSFFGLPSVSFQFLADCNSPNAYANPQNMGILFGTTLADQTVRKLGNYLPLWQIVAHEFGHMMQFSYGASWLDAQTAAPKELEADMFSGFYLILQKAFSSTQDMSTTITQAFSIGDFLYNAPNHHGTPAQRAAAVVAGGKVANEFFAGYIPKTWNAVRQRFFEELRFIIYW